MSQNSDPPRRFEIGWYNGWSPEERCATSAIQIAAVRSGTLAYPARCSICSVRGYRGSANPVWLHDENYAEPLAAHPICRCCHRTLHDRFDHPEPWLALVQQHGDGTRWFEQLTMDAASLRQPFSKSYPDGPPRDAATLASGGLTARSVLCGH